MDETRIADLVADVTGLEMVQLWHTDDLRNARADKWINVILRKTRRGSSECE
jgi:hypothetical protein